MKSLYYIAKKFMFQNAIPHYKRNLEEIEFIILQISSSYFFTLIQ